MHSRKIASLMCSATIALLLVGCASHRARMDYDPSAMFSGYHTFTWMPRRQHHALRNESVAVQTQAAIEAELVRKGFSSAADPANADFVVDFTIGPQDRIDVDTYPMPYFIPDETVYSDWWGGPYWGMQVDLLQYRERTLAVDVFDPVSRMPVWHGWAARQLTQSSSERGRASIRATVQEALQGFPPR
jgi:hypothetical protein